MGQGADLGGDLGPDGGGRYAKYVLLVLLLIYVSNQWARYLLNYLYAVSDSGLSDERADKDCISDATGMTSGEYGILVGFGFSFCYVVVGLFMGRAADMYSRKHIIAIGLVIWNAAIVLMGISTTFWQLLLSRIFLGVGEAFSAPASYSLIADYFPPSVRAEANGIFAFGVYVGGGLGSLSIAIARGIGWRGTCYIVAGYGFALAVLIRFTVKEPPRTLTQIRSKKQQELPSSENPKDAYTLSESLKVIFSSKLLVLIFVASSVRFMAGYAIGGFLPVFYEEAFPDDNTIYSYLNASVVSVGGALSSLYGGRLADRWEARGQTKARLYIPALGALLGVPTFALVVLSPNFYLSMLFLFLEYLVAECWFGPAISVLQGGMPARVRGVGIATFSFTATMAGSAMSWGLGLMISDDSSTTKIVSVLLVSVCGCYLVAGLLFLLAAKELVVEGSSASSSSSVPEERQSLLAPKERRAYEEDEGFLAPSSSGPLQHHRRQLSEEQG